MKKIATYILVALFAATILSCESDDKTYSGPPQILFANDVFSFDVSATTSAITIPVQLVASGPQAAITPTITVNQPNSAVTVPATVTIDAGRFTTALQMPVVYSSLPAGSSKLVLELSSNSVRVAEHYRITTITLVKK